MIVSIIIPSLKPPCLLRIPSPLKVAYVPPVEYEVIISQKRGLGYARNFGARQAKNDLIVFFDDDLILNHNIWDLLLSVKENSFAMLSVRGYCSTRVMAIHQKDFWKIGGFDEKIKYSAEDIDFYLRANRAGLRYVAIPEKFAWHCKHKPRSQNPLINIKAHFGHGYLIVKHARAYLEFWGGIRGYMLTCFKKPRTYFSSVLGFYYYLFKKMGDWHNLVSHID